MMPPPNKLAFRSFCSFLLAISIITLPRAMARAGEVAEPDDYRMTHFRAPVPDTLKGAEVVTSEQAFAIWKTGNTVFVDVMPQAPKPEKLPKNVIWRDKPRVTIKGAAWLPNVGFGKLHEIMHEFFSGELEALTSGDKSKPVLFYCLLDCWMSWNAAKRALQYGYTNVVWYPDGTDGWTLQDYPTETVLPKFPVK
ncbi:MAG: PQQ-dependent catabolism-associated CXXCW motif protein [Anderseniella sp.]